MRFCIGDKVGHANNMAVVSVVLDLQYEEDGEQKVLLAGYTKFKPSSLLCLIKSGNSDHGSRNILDVAA